LNPKSDAETKDSPEGQSGGAERERGTPWDKENEEAGVRRKKCKWLKKERRSLFIAIRGKGDVESLAEEINNAGRLHLGKRTREELEGWGTTCGRNQENKQKSGGGGYGLREESNRLSGKERLNSKQARPIRGGARLNWSLQEKKFTQLWPRALQLCKKGHRLDRRGGVPV